MHLNAKDSLNDQCHAKKSLIEAIKAEKQLWTFIQSTGPSDTRAQELCRKACSAYEIVILKDHEFAERHDIERAVWRIHYKYIEEFRNRIQANVANKECLDSDSVNTQDVATVPRNDTDKLLDLFRNFLSEATKFYEDLIVKIRESHGLASEFSILSESDFSYRMESTDMRKCWFSCHRCLIYLGDLARYKVLYGSPDGQICNWSVAARYYLDASLLWPNSGNPQNQLAVLATYIGDDLLAMYHCVRSLAVGEPFVNAWDNLILLFEKNRSSLSHVFAVEDATFNFLKPSERAIQEEALCGDTHAKYTAQEATGDGLFSDELDAKAVPWCHFIQMISFFYTKSRLEEFPRIFAYTIAEFKALLSLDDENLAVELESHQQHMRTRVVMGMAPFRSLQLVCALIFTIHTLNESPEVPTKPKYMEEMQQEPLLIQMAWAAAFICMGRLVERCTSMATATSPLLPCILIFVEWLACWPYIDAVDESDERCANAAVYFFRVFVDLLNTFGDWDENHNESPDYVALWEDHELQAFAPLVPAHETLDFSGFGNRNGLEEGQELGARKHRIFAATMKIINRLGGTGRWILFDKTKRRFTANKSKKSGTSESENDEHKIVTLDGGQLRGHSVLDNVVTVSRTLEEHKLEDDEKALVSGECDDNLGEEDEIIVFQRTTQTLSAPCCVPNSMGWDLLSVPGNTPVQTQISSDSSFDSCFVDLGCTEGFQFKVPFSEDSLRFPFFDSGTSFCLSDQTTDQSSFEMADSDVVGYPSLSTWSLGSEKSSTFGDLVIGDPIRCGSLGKEAICSLDLSRLSIDGIAATEQDLRISPLASNNNNGNGCLISSDDYFRTPYSTPVPSAPLLPDAELFYGGDSLASPKYKEDYFNLKHASTAFSVPFDSKDEKGTPTRCVGTSTLNDSSYSNWIRMQGPFGFDSHFAEHSRYAALPLRTDTVPPWVVHGYRDIATPHQATDLLRSDRYSLSTPIERSRDAGAPSLAAFDTWTNSSRPVNFSEGPISHPGSTPSYVGDERRRERSVFGYQSASPYYGHSAGFDQRSEQMLLLQYLKEREWQLQQQHQLRGPV